MISHKEAAYETRSNLKCSTKRFMDHLSKHNVNMMHRQCTMKVKREEYNPHAKPVGMILLDSGAEANRLWDLHNNPEIRRK